MKPLPISLPTPSLLADWPRVLRQAWSIRFSLLAACFTAAEVVLSFRRCCQVSMNALFAIKAKHNPKYSRSVMMRFSVTIYP
jgi:hypothetical protein